MKLSGKSAIVTGGASGFGAGIVRRFIAEGAGAAPVAAALAGRAGTGKVVCVISGGNLNNNYLIDILNGKVPKA